MYYAKVNWYNSYSEDDEIVHMIICAGDWNEAMQKLNGQFDYINSIEMRQIQSDKCDVVYIIEDILDVIEKENGW